jgi:hypothetical protein
MLLCIKHLPDRAGSLKLPPGDRGMHAILLVIGAFMAIVGIVLIRYGVPLDEYGNSPLLMSGMVALVGGCLLMGLFLVVRTLSRIAERLEIQPMPLPPIADIAHAAPPPRPTAPLAPPPPPAIKPEPVPISPPAAAAPDVAPPEPRIEPRVETPVALPRKQVTPKPSLLGGLFGGKGKKPVVVGRKAGPDDPSDVDLSILTTTPEPATPRPLNAGNDFASPPPAAAPAPAPPSASVYKSGVIDGMAYTLYVDGSIEAQLPQGTIRFASVEALQTYLVGRQA